MDFDFEKFCSVSLSNLNVYACLVCGKYYQGRGKKSHAYTHSLEAGHHVYINLRTENVYCLPDGYEINDPSLDDIRHVLNPRLVFFFFFFFFLFGFAADKILATSLCFYRHKLLAGDYVDIIIFCIMYVTCCLLVRVFIYHLYLPRKVIFIHSGSSKFML